LQTRPSTLEWGEDPLQHLATCEAGQTVTYRLLANKAEAAQPSPALRDAILSLMYIAISSPNGG